MLSGKSILIISPEPWNHIFVSKHHYAIHLAKKNNIVFFLNPPSNENVANKTDYERVFSVHYSGFLKGLRFYPRFLQRYFFRRKFNQLQTLCKTRFDIVWSFDNSVFFDFDSLPLNVFKISHLVDLNQDFQTKRAAASASLCLGVIPRIVERQKRYNPNAYLIRHGVSDASFQYDYKPVQLPGTNKKKALYVGNLYMPYIDWDLFIELAKKYTDVDFVFLGSNKSLIKKDHLYVMSALENVQFIGQVPSSELSNYLIASDILLLAYKPEYYNVYASPHKLMEYISTGKPVVASYTFGYDRPSELIYQAKNKTEWLSQFSFVVENLKECSSDQKAKIRKQFALENTYEKQIERIEKLIGDI